MKTILTTNYVKYLFLFAAILLTSSAIAQEEEAEEKKISISGSVDVYYQSNLSASDNVAQSFGTSFADELGFALGMANVLQRTKGRQQV